jgi:hypothetical protein
MKEINKIRLKISFIPIAILIILIFLPLPFYFADLFSYFKIMPLIILISAFFIFFVGAWWDFGANEYIKNLIVGHMELSENDLKYINRQQLIITLIYILIGLLYISIAFVLNSI